VAGLIVYSNGTCNILRPSYLHYFAGFRPMGPNNAAIVSASGEVALLVEPAWDERRAKRWTWIGDVRGVSNFKDELEAAVRGMGIDGPIGLAGGGQMPRAALATTLAIQPADDIIDEIAKQKSPEELDLVRRLGRIADAGFEAFRAKSRPGVREYELVAETEYAMRCAGADDNFILMSSGPHNTAMRNPTDRKLAPGDIIIGEITPVRDGQFFQICRTVAIGEPAPVLIEKYDLLIRAWRSAVSEIKPGVPVSAVAGAIDSILTQAGYGRYCQPPYMRTRGHGLGVGSVSPGATIDSETAAPLLENGVIVAHPNQYLPETGYLACGETYLVTSSGAERLSQTETKLYVNEI
jgi:Xaa-Pro dipeptidase